MTAIKRNRLIVALAISFGVCVFLIGDLALQRPLALQSEGIPDLFTVAVTRDVIKIDSVKAKDLKEGYDYVRISTFQDGSDSDMEHSLEKFRKAGHGHIKGLVLDLRDNPGGLLNQAVSIGDDLLNGGMVVYTQGRLGNQQPKYFAHTKK